jgi:hypothetical protein
VRDALVALLDAATCLPLMELSSVDAGFWLQLPMENVVSMPGVEEHGVQIPPFVCATSGDIVLQSVGQATASV